MTKFIEPSELAGLIRIHMKDGDDVRMRPDKRGSSTGTHYAGDIEFVSTKWSTRGGDEIIVSSHTIWGPNRADGGRTNCIGSMTTYIQASGYGVVMQISPTDTELMLTQVDNFTKMIVDRINTPDPRFN